GALGASSSSDNLNTEKKNGRLTQTGTTGEGELGEVETPGAATSEVEQHQGNNKALNRLRAQVEKYAAKYYCRELPRSAPRFAKFPPQLSARCRTALTEKLGLGASKTPRGDGKKTNEPTSIINGKHDTVQEEQPELLYSHQAETFKAVVEEKQNVFLCTSFASGKSLAYTLPLLHEWDRYLSEQQQRRLPPQSSASSSSSSSLPTPANSERPRAFLLFPTKALAQDQCNKLKKLEPDFWEVCTFDGDT
ncbi:unnamed protein product, partial [Amoebophrya sp. A25]